MLVRSNAAAPASTANRDTARLCGQLEPRPCRGIGLPRRRARRQFKDQPMFGIIAVVLVVMWLLGFFVLHVSSFLIHILLLIALVSIVMHFLRGRST
jgi:hypothetical protein